MFSHVEIEKTVHEAEAQATRAVGRNILEAEGDAVAFCCRAINEALRTPAATRADLAAKTRLFKTKMEADGPHIAYDDGVAAELNCDLDSLIADALRLAVD